MAGYVATLANWDALLQEDYVQGKIVSAVNTATPFRDTLKRTSIIGGRRRIYGTKVGTSQAGGARPEGAAMPDYGAGEYQDVIVQAKYNYAPFKITGQAEEFSTKAAFVEFGMQILKDTQEGLKLFTGRQCWGDGTGTLALINNGAGYAAGSTTFTVDSAYGQLWGSLAANTTFLLKRNMIVQLGSDDNNGAGYKITSVAGTTFSIAAPGLAVAAVDNALVATKGSAGYEIEGILKFGATAALQTTLGLGTTFYHGIDRGAYPEWEGNVLNVSAALSFTNIRSLRDAIYKRTDDEESNLFICSTEIARDYEALLQATVRTTTAPILRGGVSMLQHDGLNISKDSKAPAKAFFLLDTGTLNWAQTRDPHWLTDGQGIMRVVPGTDAKEALLRWYANLDQEQPRRVGIGYNVTVS